MKTIKINKLLSILTAVIITFSVCCVSFSANTTDSEITSSIKFSSEDIKSFSKITDSKNTTHVTVNENSSITLSSDTPISSVYIIFEKEYKEISITNKDNSKTITYNDMFLHQYIDIKNDVGVSKNIVITFKDGKAKIAEIRVFKDGQLPGDVQIWEPSCKNADLMIVTTHADDEHLFFAGTIPYYTSAGYAVQVVYITDHTDNTLRHHERLDGLWTAGLKTYPIFGRFEDAWSESVEEAERNLKNTGKTRDDIIKFLTLAICETKPLVILGQDFKGEYGHGQHMLGAECLASAVELASVDNPFPEETYEAYTVPKLYIHLYNKNEITLNYDTPQDNLGGKTPFQISQDAYKCHKTQQSTWFTKWIMGNKSSPITKATQIKTHSPVKFGLYYTTVGNDTKDDLFENITPYFLRTPVIETPEITEEPITSEPTSNTDSSITSKTVIFSVAFSILILLCAVLIVILQRNKK